MVFLKLLFVLLATGYVVSQVRLFRLATASQRWPFVKGKVLRSYVDEHLSLNNRNSEQHRSYSANVVYSYQVGTRQFESTRLTYAPTTGLGEDAVTALLDGITEGADVDVFYDPLHHDQAVLIPGSSGNVFQLAVSIVLLGFSIALSFARHDVRTHRRELRRIRSWLRHPRQSH